MTGAADTWTGQEWPDEEETKRRLRDEEGDALRPTDSEENVFVLMDPGDTPLPRRRAASAGVAPPRRGRRITDDVSRHPALQVDGPQAEPPSETTERWEREPSPDTTEHWECDERLGMTERGEEPPPEQESLPEKAPPPPRPAPPRREERRTGIGSSSGARSSADVWGSEPRSHASGRQTRKSGLGLGTKLVLFGGLSFGLAFTAARFLPSRRPATPTRPPTAAAQGKPPSSRAGVAAATPPAGGTPAPAIPPEVPDLLPPPPVRAADDGLRAPMRKIIGCRGTVVLTNGEEIDGRFLGFERTKLLLGISNGRTGIPFTRIADLRLQDGTSVWEQSFTERQQEIERQEAKRRATLGGGRR